MTKNEQIINRILKGGVKGYSPFTFLNSEYKMFTNGYYALGSDNSFGNKISDKCFDFNSIFYEGCFDEIKFEIDIKDLKQFLKEHRPVKTKPITPYILENRQIKIGFNPRYLLDSLEFCKTNIISVTEPIKPAFVKSIDTSKIGLVMPIKLNIW